MQYRSTHRSPLRLAVLANTLLSCVLMSTACGGGGDAASSQPPLAQELSANAAPAVRASNPIESDAASALDTGPDYLSAGITGTALVSWPATETLAEATDETTAVTAYSSVDFGPTMKIAAVSNAAEGGAVVQQTAQTTLITLSTAAAFTAQSYGSTATCMVGYRSAGAPTQVAAATPPADGAGLLYSATDLVNWKTRIKSGPFLKADDYMKGSPGDWTRITTNAAKFLVSGETVLTASNEAGLRASHGVLARDAALVMLLNGETSKYLPGVRDFLITNLESTVSDYTRPCYRNLDGKSAPDVFFPGAPWLARLLVTYDFARGALSATDRLRIEKAILKQAHAFATYLDEGLATNFPLRTSNNYTTMARDAVLKGDSRWYSKIVDLNGDGKYDAAELATKFPAYAYVRADGVPGPRLSYLTQWYNNRRSGAAMFIGIAGALLERPELIERSKRYFYEWMTYSMAADGSDGEFQRNGEYNVARQGLIYDQSNLQGALLAARAMARRGDRDMYNFSTMAGLNGTEVPAGQLPKSLATSVRMHVELLQSKLNWYLHEPQLNTQNPRPATHLGRLDSNYMGSAKANDNFHELGLIFAANEFSTLNVAKLLMRDASLTQLRFPGSNGNAVWTGSGIWTDCFGMMPAAFLLRP
jgi:hypothetical protein